MLVGDVDKQPGETKRYVWNYSSWLGTGEVLVDCAVVADSDELEIVDGSVEIGEDNQTIIALVRGGEDGGEYVLTVTATTSLGQVKEDEVIVRVLELHGA